MVKLIERKSRVKPKESIVTDRQSQIAKAAYYLAEKRGFEPGHELDDWFAAESLADEARHLD